MRRNDWGGRSRVRKNDEKEAKEERVVRSARCYIKVRKKKRPLDLVGGSHCWFSEDQFYWRCGGRYRP